MCNCIELQNRLRKLFRGNIRKKMRKTRKGWKIRSDSWMKMHRRGLKPYRRLRKSLEKRFLISSVKTSN